MSIASPWRLIGASVRGTSHQTTGAPCQDRNYLRSLSLPAQGEVAILIASDGAGSAAHSHLGADIACESIYWSAAIFLTSGNVLADVTRDHVLQWFDRAAQRIEMAAATAGHSVRDYACTLLFAIAGPDHAVFGQVGDGAIVFNTRSERDWLIASWPQHGEFLNTTRFLIDPASRASLEFTRVREPIRDIAVFTDGIEQLCLHYASKTVHAPFFDAIFPPLRSSLGTGNLPGLSSQLEAYLASPVITQRTDDDVTLLMASRNL